MAHHIMDVYGAVVFQNGHKLGAVVCGSGCHFMGLWGGRARKRDPNHGAVVRGLARTASGWVERSIALSIQHGLCHVFDIYISFFLIVDKWISG
jgi:hypothetical protein